METMERAFDPQDNPLKSNSPEVWDRLVEAIGPASIFLIIRSRMSAFLLQRFSPEDIWQETLIHAWRDRERFEWRGVKSFRRWLLKIVENRIRDLAEREKAAKRGGKVVTTSLDAGGDDSSRLPPNMGPVASTTPSRVAIYREQSDVMHCALESLAPELREVVRLRLFEELTMPEVASKLEISLDAAKHRFRKGCFDYERRLTTELASRSGIME